MEFSTSEKLVCAPVRGFQKRGLKVCKPNGHRVRGAGGRRFVKHTIAIVGGTGPEGVALGLRFAHAGASVRIGSRSVERAQAASQRIMESLKKGSVEGYVNADAVREAGIVVLTVPPEAQVETLESLRPFLRPGIILVDATVRLKAAENSAQTAAEHVPANVTVASAFHTLGSELLNHLEIPVDSDVLICSDNPETRTAVADLVRLLEGARPVDAGGLKNSRLIENMVQLLIALNRHHRVKHAGIRITGL
jgi:NADPH-dependent F420 reductase